MAKTKRYQNLTTLNVSVVKDTFRGMRSYPLKPGQIVAMSEEEVRASNDSHERIEDSPFEKGWIKEVPEGMHSHPEAPNLGRNPTNTEAERLVEARDADKFNECLENIRDHAGLLTLRRALSALEGDKADRTRRFVRFAEQKLDERAIRIDHLIEQRSERYAINRN